MFQLFDTLPERPQEAQRYHRIAGPGMQLAVVTYGDPSNPALLLVHGALQSQLCWRYQYEALAQQYYVVALDLPWHGDSSLVPSDVVSTPEIWADSIRAVIVSLHLLDRPLCIGCWSFGGLVIRNYISRYGLGKIQGLLSVASILPGMAFSLSALFQKPDAAFVTEQLANTQGDLQQRIGAVERFVVNLTNAPLDPLERYLTYGYNLRSFLALEHLGASLMADVADDANAFLANITVPVLLVHGDQDALVPVELAQQTAQRLAVSNLLVYPKCGHSPFVEYADRFNRDVAQFLAGVLAS